MLIASTPTLHKQGRHARLPKCRPLMQPQYTEEKFSDEVTTKTQNFDFHFGIRDRKFLSQNNLSGKCQRRRAAKISAAAAVRRSQTFGGGGVARLAWSTTISSIITNVIKDEMTM